MPGPKVKLERTKATKFAYVEHVGAYGSIPVGSIIPRLYEYSKRHGLRPGFFPMGVFHDSPVHTPPEKCRSEIGIAVSGKAEPEGDIKVRKLPASRVAAISHKGPSSDYQKTYHALGEWISSHGYEWAGPAIEVYTKRPVQDGGETILFARIKAPVKKRKAAVK